MTAKDLEEKARRFLTGEGAIHPLPEAVAIFVKRQVNEELSNFCDFAIEVDYLEEEDKTPLINMFNYRNIKLKGKAPEDFHGEFLNRLYD